MPKQRPTHFREQEPPPQGDPERRWAFTRDGLRINKVKWSFDPNDATCNNCVRLIASDEAKANRG